ncbi:MAG TPA: TonB-dependent receptor [Chitinophagaceae bacterium]|nr:TonB-dependent receptor [Chitinophagaceae bacterium]
MKKLFFVLAAVIISTQLLAQDSLIKAQDSEKELDPVVISATKFPVKTSLTGKVITVITKEQLERSGGKDFSQLLAEQAGIYIAGANSNAGKDKSVYLRGARIDHTLICINGIPVYDPGGIGGNFDLRNFSISNIERIEILKGSQSTLYGSDAIAGVINIITRSISGKKAEGNVNVSYGSYETFRGSTGLNGKSGNLDYNASYSFNHSRGINETVNKSNAAVTDWDGFTQHSFQFGAGIKPTEKIYIQPFFRYSNNKGDIDQGAFTDELDYTYKQKSWQAGIGNFFKLRNKKLYVNYSYNSIDRIYIDDSVKSRNGYDTYSKGKYKGGEHFAETYLTATLKKQLALTAGIDFRSSSSDQDFFSVGFFGPFSSKYSADSLHQNQFGIYAAFNLNTEKGFNAEAGSRVNFHSEYGSHTVFNFNPSYLINKKVKLFANFSSAYRTPSLYQLFSEYGNKKLKPESGNTIEGGVQYYATGNKFMGRVVGFARNVKDVIFFYYNSSTFTSQYINQDRQKDHGLELEAFYNVTKDIKVKAFYTFVTGEITTRKGGKDTTYNNLLRRPKSSGGLNISAKINKHFLLSSNFMVVGKRTDAYFDNSSFITVNTTLKSYALLDIYAEYAFIFNRLKVFADLRNITGSKYTEISGFSTLGFTGAGGIRFTF